jgi:hypothetical protein
MLGVVLAATVICLTVGMHGSVGAAEADDPVIVVPNPYSVSGRTYGSEINVEAFERIRFANVPDTTTCTISIYTSRGHLVTTLKNVQGGPNMYWSGRTEDNQYVVSDVYVFVVQAPGVPRQIGKFVIVR